MPHSTSLFTRAQRVMPGGVNSPVRAFGQTGLTPRFIAKANGATLTDVDGNTYLDCVNSFGPAILGHNHPKITQAITQAVQNGTSFGACTQAEVEMAELITSLVPSVEMIRMVNSGTEAVMSAIRTARGYTGRNKILKFAGCYHGHCDTMLVKAGSGAMTTGIPNSAGVPSGCTQDTLVANYNDSVNTVHFFDVYGPEIAAIVLEPVAANMGVVLPDPQFLSTLRTLCDQYGALLIFDEVITGFRLGLGGAQAHFGITPDLTTFGKIIGAGLPVGAYGGKREIMQTVAPLGSVYQAGTLSGNPVAMAAGLAQLTELKENPQIYTHLNTLGERLRSGLQAILTQFGKPYTVTGIGSLCCLFFTPQPVIDYDTASAANTAQYAAFFRHMLRCGIYLAPSQFEAIFLSNAHTQANIDKILHAAYTFFETETNT